MAEGLQIFGKQVSEIFFLPEISTESKPGELPVVQGVTTITPARAVAMSAFGTPILSPITFKRGNYFRYSGGELIEETMEELRLPVTAMITPSQAKMMVKTDLQGGAGSVKEIVGISDWSLTIDGRIIKERNQPQGAEEEDDMMQRLAFWNQIADSISVSCPLFMALNIFKITIEDISFKPIRGSQNIDFSIKAYSDDIDEIIEGLI